MIFVEVDSHCLGGMQPSIAQHWMITGRYEMQTKSFNGFKRLVYCVQADRCECIIPSDNESLIQFIANERIFVGIGESKARAIVNKFSKKLYETITKNTASEIAAECNLSIVSAENLKKGFRKYSNMKYARWLSDLKVPLSIVQRVIKYHKSETIDLITKNPWKLMDFGLSFEKANIAAQSFLVKQNKMPLADFLIDSRRLLASLDAAMMSICKRGHTVASRSEVKLAISKYSIPPKLIEPTIDLAVKTKRIYAVGDGRYQTVGVHVMEAVIAKRLIKLSSRKSWTMAEEAAFNDARADAPFLNRNQLMATRKSVESGTSVITGGAGTGKTTVVKTVLKAHINLGYEVHGVAIAGRAAMRMQESAGCKACTIAKYLRLKPPKHGERFVLVVDEASMVDIATMFALVTHLPDTTKIILVGDVQQLPSIGAGRLFADVINSGVISSTFLTKVERQDSSTGIPEYSQKVVTGTIPDSLSMKNVSFFDTNIDNIEQKLISLTAVLGKDTQIVGMTKNGNKNRAGIRQINTIVQNSVNPSSAKITASNNTYFEILDIRNGDRVLFTKNNYDAKVWNGTLGRVAEVEVSQDSFAKVVTDDGDIIDINYELMMDIELSYAITVHKAQGSQFENIIIVLTNPAMLDRCWLYTAITRAERKVSIVGPKEMLIKAINTPCRASKRKTNLQSLLEQQSIIS